jgi:transposase-like protein
MPKSHPPYSPEFRQRIVELVRTGRTPEELARQFEPSAQAIRNWVKQAALDAGVVFAMQSAHWAPLWARRYSTCVAQRPEPNTMAGIVRPRIACATFATDLIRKQW